MRLKNSKIRKRHAISLAIPLLLSACFGGEKQSAPPPNPTIKPPAGIKPSAPKIMDSTNKIVLAEESTHTISLLASVEAPEKMDLSLTSVASLSNDCPAPVIDPIALSYKVTPGNPQICIYRATLKNTTADGLAAESSADNYVRITHDTNDNRPPLSLPHFTFTFKENVPFEIPVIDKLKELGVDIAGKTLSTDVVVLRNGSAIKITENLILLTPDKGTRISRLVYTLIDASNDQNIEAGSIDVFIEQADSTLPSARDFTYPTLGVMGEKMTGINVGGSISSTNGDSLVLASVSTLNAFATLPSAPTCKTCFDFLANEQGQYTVNYVISDQSQGYTSAVVTLNIDKPWKNITTLTSLKNFNATPSEIEAKEISLNISSLDETYPGTLGIKIPRMTYLVASAFCAAQGKRLPFENELITLYNQSGKSLYLAYGWPANTPYWIDTNSEQDAVSLENGTLITPVIEAFVTCTNPDILDIKVSPIKPEIHKGTKLQFIASEINDTDVTIEITNAVEWKSDKPHVAKVDSNGLVTALEVGNTTISATYSGKTSSISGVVTVFKLLDITVTPGGIESHPLNVTQQLTALSVYEKDIKPTKQTPITWRSDNPTRVSVDATGLIKTLAPGRAQIYAVMNGEKGTFESLNPLIVNVLNQSEIMGNTGKNSASISASVYPSVEFRSGPMIYGIYTKKGNTNTLIAGGKEGSTVSVMTFADIKTISVYTLTVNGVKGITKLTWEGQNGTINTVGSDNTEAVLAKTINITTPIKSMTAHWSEETLDQGFITGLVFHFD